MWRGGEGGLFVEGVEMWGGADKEVPPLQGKGRGWCVPHRGRGPAAGKVLSHGVTRGRPPQSRAAAGTELGSCRRRAHSRSGQPSAARPLGPGGSGSARHGVAVSGLPAELGGDAAARGARALSRHPPVPAHLPRAMRPPQGRAQVGRRGERPARPGCRGGAAPRGCTCRWALPAPPAVTAWPGPGPRERGCLARGRPHRHEAGGAEGGSHTVRLGRGVLQRPESPARHQAGSAGFLFYVAPPCPTPPRPPLR